jgi:2-dehydropantoate 2-reductase
MNEAGVAVFGAGAVGCYFGGLLAKAGESVTLIGRPGRVDAINGAGLDLNTTSGRWTVPIPATTDPAVIRESGVVFISVKTPDTESAARVLAPLLAPDTVVVSLQNGVDNAERMHEAAGVPALAAAVYVAVQMTGPGTVTHTGRGDMVVGDPLAEMGKFGRRNDQLAQVAALFARANVPCKISDNVRAELWTKLAMNCAYNAISALARVRYGKVLEDPPCRDLMERVIRETVDVARGSGVDLSAEKLLEAAWRLGAAMREALSSTAQDLLQGKVTEIDSLNGYVSRAGKRLGIATPANTSLHALVKLAEQSAAKSGVLDPVG